MYFKQFLTEVSTGDLIAFNKAVERGEFAESDQGETIKQFFRERGYKVVGSGFFATVLQSTDYYIVKIAQNDERYNKYVELVRRGRRNPHFPVVIAQRKVDTIDVYFIERLYPFHDLPPEEFIPHYTKKDAPMFLWLAANFLNHSDGRTAKSMLGVVRALDPSIELDPIPDHPGYGDDRRMDQYWVNIHAYERTLEDILDKGKYNHPFLQAIQQIKKIKESMDLHTGNIMIRKPSYDLVITDPLA